MTPDIDDVLTIDPCPCFIIIFPTALETIKTPSKLTLMMRRQSSRLISSMFTHCEMPALLKSTSMRPSLRRISSVILSTSVGSVTSTRTANVRPPSEASQSAVCLAVSRSKSAITMSEPACAKLWAMALPKPLAAPVIIETLFLKLNCSKMFILADERTLSLRSQCG